ncbi:Tensin-3, partial [Schistosoma japonicum]
YAGYMEMFSPVNSLSILRAPLHIYQIYLYNFPVFEKNQLRLYFKFYTGSPPVHLYTTQLYEFQRTSSPNLVLNFHSNSNPNIGLQLSGDIIILAYHSKSYPLKRTRLFRIHIHSCQGVENWIRFVPSDFDEISESFPSSMSLILNLTSKSIPLTDDNINSKIENIYKLKSAFTSPSENLLNNQHNPEDRSRLHDSLENLTEPIQSRHLPLQLAPCLNKKNHFRYLCPNTKLDSSVNPCKLLHVNDNKINELNTAIDNDEKVKSHYDPWLSTSINKRITSGAYSYLDAGLESVQEEFDNVNNHDDDYAGDHPVDNEMKHSTNNNSQSETDSLESDNYDPNSRRQQNHHESSSSSSSLSFKKLHPKYLFQSKKPKHKSPEDVNNNQEERKSGKDFNEQGCMPPPSSTTVLKKYSKKHKSIGTRIVNFFSAHSKHRKLDSDQSINNSSIHSSDSSNNNNINVDYDDSSELSLGQQSSEGNSNNKSISRKTHASCRGIPTEKLGPPCKTRKVLSVGTSPTHSIEPVQAFYPTEDLVEAARYLNFMAGTQELDRLLEELRLTSMNMAAGLPPPSSTHYNNSKQYYSSQTSRKPLFHDEVYPDNRYTPNRSASVTGYSTDAHNFNDTLHSNYYKHSTYYSDRIDNIGKSSSTNRFNTSFSTSPRHQSVFTTTLKQRPPVAPRKFNQIHLTIDPDCGTTDAHSAVSVRLDNHDSFRREKKLESDLQSAREELANLRRAMSLVDERHQRVENLNDSRNLLSPSHSVPRRSPNIETQQYSSTSSPFQRSYQVQQHSTSGSVNSYQQRTYPRKEPASVYKSQIIPVDVNFTAPQRTMSHTNVYGPRSWNLRSYQGSESDLAYKREMSSSSSRLARSGYSARRERLKQEREQELLRQTRLRQMAASSTGLHDHRQYQQQNSHHHHQQQHYRSTSAVNKSMGNTEAFEEFETITLQPIGRGVQDLDSHVGSLTTLARGGGASSMIEVHKHTSRTPRMYSPISCQFNRAHSTTPTRYSRPTRGFSNNLYKSQPVFGGSMEAYPMFKSRTPDPGRDITGSPLWTALPRNSSTTPTTYKSWRSERNITNMLSEPITYDDVMLNTQMAKIQVLESSDLPATLFPYSKKSIGQQPIEVVKKDIKLFETEGSVCSGQLDKNEPEMINLKKVVSMKKPPERSRLWALPDSMKIVRSSNGYLPLAHHPNDINLDDDGQTIDHELDLLEPGTTMLRTEINGLSHIDDHQHPRASSRASLARQPFAST